MQKKKFIPGNRKFSESSTKSEKEIPVTDAEESDDADDVKIQEIEKIEDEISHLKLTAKSLSKNVRNGFFSFTVNVSDEKNQHTGTITFKPSGANFLLEFNINGQQSSLKFGNPASHITTGPLPGNVIATHPILAKYPKERKLEVFNWNTTYKRDSENVLSWDTSALDPSFTSVELKQSFVTDAAQVVKCLSASYIFSK